MVRKNKAMPHPQQSAFDRLAKDERTVVYEAPKGVKTLPTGFGPGPSGKLHVELRSDVECPGFSKAADACDGVIELTYEIPGGVQRPYQKNPGVAYEGIKRRAYIPNTPSGRRLLTRYKYAFTHGYTFVVGWSITFKKDNMVTWATLLHKTTLTKATDFGFPDPDFFLKAHKSLDKLQTIPTEDQLLLNSSATNSNDGVEAVAIEVQAVTAAAATISVEDTTGTQTSATAAAKVKDTNVQTANPEAPYLTPMAINLTTVTVPKSWILTKAELKKCGLLERPNPKSSNDTWDVAFSGAIDLSRTPGASNRKAQGATKRLEQHEIPIEVAENLVFIHSKSLEENPQALLSSFAGNLSKAEPVLRAIRTFVVTPGTIQLKSVQSFMGLLSKDRKVETVKFSLFDVRSIHMPGNNVVLVAYSADATSTMSIQYAMYQSPVPVQAMAPLVSSLVSAYVSVPSWAIPITWSGELPNNITPIADKDYQRWLGDDGGLASALYSAILSFLVLEKRPNLDILRREGRAGITNLIHIQQPAQSFVLKKQERKLQQLNLVELAEELAGKDHKELIPIVMNRGLDALSFNLVFRKLLVRKYLHESTNLSIPFCESMSKTLLYNVTLREIDFSGTSLQGFGESIGQSLAMNAQPLISKVNFSNCNLTARDLRGMLPGLARIWCSGTTLLESLIMAGNPGISPSTWDLFFVGLVDPSTLPFWPQAPPPPPNLAFCQEVNLVDTEATGVGLARFLQKCHGLKTLTFSAHSQGTTNHSPQVLSSLIQSECPIESLDAKNLSSDCLPAILSLHLTLRRLVLTGFVDDLSLVISSWPQPVPELSVEIQATLPSTCADLIPLSSAGNSPGSLRIRNDSSNLNAQLIRVLASQATGLKTLTFHGLWYHKLSPAVASLAFGSLEHLHIYPPKGRCQISSHREGECRIFWKTLAASKKLEQIVIPDQIYSPEEVSMLGEFLKQNRSVRRFRFDSKHLHFQVDDVKVLRSAFYGNKKVVELEYPKKAYNKTIASLKAETQQQTNEVTVQKQAIKTIFKRHYSKYNRNWRAKPNQLKLPHVEKIRVAKRRIGQIQRDTRKMATLFNEINAQVGQNLIAYQQVKREKDAMRLSGRQRQLEGLAAKKRKAIATLVTKLHQAKKKGRQKKTVKTQVPRSSFYRSRHLWPTSKKRGRRRPHSRYYYNDPYYSRYFFYNGYYDDDFYDRREEYLNDNSAIPVCPAPVQGDVPTETTDSEISTGNSDSCGQYFAPILAGVNDTMNNPIDPWDGMDTLVGEQAESVFENALSAEYLTELHNEAAELGPDVVAEIAPVLDTCAAVDGKLDHISGQTEVSRDHLDQDMNSSLDQTLEMAVILSNLDPLPGFEMDDVAVDVDDVGADANVADDIAVDADIAVDMYAGAGPRDLDDGGPSFGKDKNAALSGARRRARVRKQGKHARRILSKTPRKGYRNLHLSSRSSQEGLNSSRVNDLEWPSNIVSQWQKDVRQAQIRAMAEMNEFSIPTASSQIPYLICEWRQICREVSDEMLEVALVTQCSLDRLSNLKAQLLSWTGKASVAIYLKSTEDFASAKRTILSLVEDVRDHLYIDQKHTDNFEVAISIIRAHQEDDEYPINFLRNAALLEARRQQLQRHGSLRGSGVVLVDVDFRPSSNLHHALHCKEAREAIVVQRRAVVVPAFEAVFTENCPSQCDVLEKDFTAGKVEGFHQAHFPQGHGPTRFDKFFRLSRGIRSPSDCWSRLYRVDYEDNFEPYIVMASGDVPLYDERFQGYGLNKVSHLAAVAKQLDGSFHVLPGAFVIAPGHERSESWKQRYGTQSDETLFNQLWLKGLYCNFKERLAKGLGPIVSERTLLNAFLLQKEEEQHNSSRSDDEPLSVSQGIDKRRLVAIARA